jgi:hypothetical protein
MAQWMELLKQRPPLGADGFLERKPLIIGQYSSHPLARAGDCLDRERRRLFPMLSRVGYKSVESERGTLWLDSAQAAELLRELQQIRRICHRQEYITGFDGHRYYDRWRQSDSAERFEGWLDGIEALLAAAQGDRCIFLCL